MMQRARLLCQIDMKEILEAFNSQKIICIPTDTLYAISCDATSSQAVQEIYNIKKRTLTKPLPIFVSDMDMATRYVKLCEKEIFFARKFWPGPLTIIAHKVNKISIPSALVKQNKLAIRIPNSKLIQDICKSIDKPIIGTSANISSTPSINSTWNIKKEFGNKVDIIVKNEKFFDSNDFIQSTIIEFTTNNSYKVIRTGKVSEIELYNALRNTVAN